MLSPNYRIRDDAYAAGEENRQVNPFVEIDWLGNVDKADAGTGPALALDGPRLRPTRPASSSTASRPGPASR